MGTVFGLTAPDALAMWVADMDFRAPAPVRAALEQIVASGVYGYPGENRAYLDAIRWWMRTRHGWDIARDDILSVHGLVNGTALAVDAYTAPGDAVVLMTPVYHAFARVVKAAGRTVTELPLALRTILAGIKTAAVINVGTATLGALIGAGGYGQPILTGIRLDDLGLILEGAVPAALLALAVQGLFEGIERGLVPRGLRLAARA